jgi:ATP-dependent helicase/nuclease subunit B
MELGDEAWKRLERMLHYYNDQNHGYVSRAFPSKGRTQADFPYDHLARVFEWSATGSEDSDDDAGDHGSEADA